MVPAMATAQPVVRMPVTHSRGPLAPLPIWDGADPNYTAEDVTRIVETRARYLDSSLRRLQHLLASVVGPHVAAPGVRH
jgi:hypothetical protein